MRQSEAMVDSKVEGIGQGLPLIPIVPPLIGMVAWGCVVVGLAAALYAAPLIAVVGLAMLGFGLPIIWLLWTYPEVGLLGLVVLTSSFIAPDVVKVSTPIGGGLDLRDLALLGMLGMLIVKGVIRKQLTKPWWPVGGPLLVFIAAAILSMVYATVYMGVEAHSALNELRNLVYYASFFITVWVISQRKQLVRVLVGLLVIVDLVTTIIILQQFLGTNNHLLNAMTGNLWYIRQQGGDPAGFGVVRIVPPGHVLIYVMSIISFCLMVSSRQSLRMCAAFAFQFVYLNIGLLFTYTRAQWIASAIALILIAIFLAPTDKSRLLRQILIMGVVLLLVYSVFADELQRRLSVTVFVDEITNRALSIFDPKDTLDSSSLEWRSYENGEVFKSLSQHPLLGVGLGNSYRNVTLLGGEASGWWGTLASGRYGGFTRYVHNSYLYIAVKMGALGLLAWLGLCLAFLANSWRVYKTMADSEYRRVTLAIIMSFIGLMTWAITHSHFMRTDSAIVIGIMFGVIASMRQIGGVRVSLSDLAREWGV